MNIIVHNVVQKMIPKAYVASFGRNSFVTLVIDTDIPQTDILKENISLLKKHCTGVRIAWIESGNLELPDDTLASIVRVCRVMIRYYDDFMVNIWPEEKRKITGYIDTMRKLFEESDADPVLGKANPGRPAALWIKYLCGSIIQNLN